MWWYVGLQWWHAQAGSPGGVYEVCSTVFLRQFVMAGVLDPLRAEEESTM